MTYTSPESQANRKRLQELERRIELKQQVHETLDLTEKGLANQLQETVNRRQHGFANDVDVEDAARKLQDFRDSRWRKERDTIEAIDKS